MRILLDTNTYSAMVQGHENVCALVRMSERVFFSTVVIGELLAGFRGGSRFDSNRRVLDEVLDSPYVRGITVTRATADRFARIWAALRAKRHPIPTNDVWIAAHAMETGADLVSFDDHFAAIDGLAWIHLKSTGS